MGLSGGMAEGWHSRMSRTNRTHIYYKSGSVEDG